MLTNAKHNLNDQTGTIRQLCVRDTELICISPCIPGTARDSFRVKQVGTIYVDIRGILR